MGSVFFIALRRLRAPLILIILIFAVAIVGLALIPGVDSEGRAWHMSPFQAFYFVTYTATTIGFGEVPHAFTDEQRLWVTVVIYLSVVGWAFLLGSLLALTQDQGFQQAIVVARFRRSVRQLREPFYIVCGLGETGLMVVRSLDRLGFRFVVIDADATRLHELELQELGADALGLAGEARAPETLVLAGVLKPECSGVLALTNDDEVNLAVAISVHLLHPQVPVICRSHTAAVTTSMATVNTYQVIDPFKQFGDYLLMAMQAPDSHRLLAWLTGPPGAYLQPRVPAPPGHWIVCGYGRFGSRVAAAIQSGGFDVTVIDPDAIEPEDARLVRGYGTDAETLAKAGIAGAVGIVAGTDNDTSNLAIAIGARQLNRDLFVIARQNLVSNQLLFGALGADMTMISSQIIANECVAMLRTPLLAEFLSIVRSRGDVWAAGVVERLRVVTEDLTPDFWSFVVSSEATPGLTNVLRGQAVPVTISDLHRSTSNRDEQTRCTALLLQRDGQVLDLPPGETVIRAEDHLLFAGTADAQNDQRSVLRNVNIAEYVLAGRGSLGGSVWRWAAGRRDARAS
ncbi:MAG: NAD-binding protein [Hyphomicrobiaceae bacterium]|nr:NAD-binding protein [Hyphomicrobiaceae bacterium]